MTKCLRLSRPVRSASLNHHIKSENRSAVPERLGDPLKAARFYLYFISISFPIILYVMLLQDPSAPLQLLILYCIGFWCSSRW